VQKTTTRNGVANMLDTVAIYGTIGFIATLVILIARQSFG
jgi:hypothetical protein